jgi:hypothetical protein
MEIEIIKVLVYGFSVILVALFVYITALAGFFYIKIKNLRSEIKNQRSVEEIIKY